MNTILCCSILLRSGLNEPTAFDAIMNIIKTQISRSVDDILIVAGVLSSQLQIKRNFI